MTTTATKPRERPILFSGPMVKAILGGRKTMTRRVVKPQPPAAAVGVRFAGDQIVGHRRFGGPIEGFAACPYGQPGDLLWCREKHALYNGSSTPAQLHDATYCCFPDGSQTFKEGGYYHWDKPVMVAWPTGHRWRSPIHMPRWASRITLRLDGVRVERLQAITEEDARAEGVERFRSEFAEGTFRYAFATTWNDLNAKRGHGWDVNPWVWVLSFERITP